jgi:hypothetical protein
MLDPAAGDWQGRSELTLGTADTAVVSRRVIASVTESIVFGVPARLAGQKPRPETAGRLADGDVPAPPPVEAG